MKETRDLVKAYLDDIQEYELLTKEEEAELLERAKNKDEEAKNKLILSNLRLVVKIAKNHVNKGLSFIDLISEGNIGLIRAIDKFDNSKGYRFSTYAVWWIRQAISKAIINKGREIRIPSYKYDMLNKINSFISAYMKEGNSYPSVEEVAEGIEMPKEKVEQVILEFQDLISLNTSIGTDIYLEDVLIEDPHVSPENIIIDQLIKEDVKKSLSILKEREKQIIEWRYGLESTEPKTLEEVGKLLGITRERVRQIEKKALQKLRQNLKNELKEYIDY